MEFKVFLLLFFWIYNEAVCFVCKSPSQSFKLKVNDSIPFTSVDYPKPYSGRQFCLATVYGGPGTTYRFTCSHFNIPSESGCKGSMLILKETKTGRNKILCGQLGSVDYLFENPDPEGIILQATVGAKKSGGSFDCLITSVPASTPSPVCTTTTVCTTVTTCSDESSTTEEVYTLPTPDKFKCRCGTIKIRTRIVGGTLAYQHEFPWLVALFQVDKIIPFCVGSMVTDRHILTAAHCMLGETPSSIIVGTSYHNLRQDDDYTRREPVKRISSHPQYNRETNDYDFAVLELTYNVHFRRELHPICLPEDTSETYVGYKCTVAGWGRTAEDGQGREDKDHKYSETLKKALVTVISNEECKKQISILTPRMICAIGDNGQDSCNDDSGGPLACPKNGNFDASGVVSFGKGCGRPGVPGVYSRVTSVMPWLQKEIQTGKKCPRTL